MGLGHGYIYEAFSGLQMDIGGPSLLWMIPFLGRCVWAIKKVAEGPESDEEYSMLFCRSRAQFPEPTQWLTRSAALVPGDPYGLF